MELVKFHAQGSELVIETATEFNEFSWWYKMYLEVRAVPVMGIGCISVIPHETMFTGSAQEKSSGLLQVPVTLPVMNSITYQCLMPLKVITALRRETQRLGHKLHVSWHAFRKAVTDSHFFMGPAKKLFSLQAAHLCHLLRTKIHGILRYHQAAVCTSSLPWSAAFCNQPRARASRGGVIPRLMSRRSTFAIVFPTNTSKHRV